MIRAVPVHDHEALEPVVGDRARDVEQKLDERRRLDVDRPGIVHDVVAVAVGDRGQHQHLGRGTARGLVDHRRTELRVDVERKMRTVLLGRPDGQDDDLVHGDSLVDLGPGQQLIAILTGDGLTGGAGHWGLLVSRTRRSGDVGGRAQVWFRAARTRPSPGAACAGGVTRMGAAIGCGGARRPGFACGAAAPPG